MCVMRLFFFKNRFSQGGDENITASKRGKGLYIILPLCSIEIAVAALD